LRQWLALRNRIPSFSPRRRFVIFQELTPDMGAGQLADEDWVDDACGAIDDVERRGEAFLCFAGGTLQSPSAPIATTVWMRSLECCRCCKWRSPGDSMVKPLQSLPAPLQPCVCRFIVTTP
jgi:hypothetical protein